mmetsp:Transcript_17407/g.55094  ORF Transcript_17407/g.55094 Transcript_17407/m.55094 type:complete len:322 (+) Transcript_17407:1137-2102(+)
MSRHPAPMLASEDGDGYNHEAPVENGHSLEELGNASRPCARGLVLPPLEPRGPHGLAEPVPSAIHLVAHGLPHSGHGGLRVVLCGQLLRLADTLLHGVSNRFLDLPDRDLLLGGHCRDDAACWQEDVTAIDGAEQRGGERCRHLVAADAQVELVPDSTGQVGEAQKHVCVVAHVRERAVDVHVVRMGLVRAVAAAIAFPRDDGEAGATGYASCLHGPDLAEGEVQQLHGRGVQGVIPERVPEGLPENHGLAVHFHGQVAIAHAEPAIAFIHARDHGTPEGNSPEVPLLGVLTEAEGHALGRHLQVAVVHEVVGGRLSVVVA